MKLRISATIEKETLEKIKKILNKGKYRNLSHFIEEAIKDFYERNKGGR
ncbi:MAG: ribbon-helix-helix domain-containing protein [Candidatus Pacearchaeota archaeon]